MRAHEKSIMNGNINFRFLRSGELSGRWGLFMFYIQKSMQGIFILQSLHVPPHLKAIFTLLMIDKDSIWPCKVYRIYESDTKHIPLLMLPSRRDELISDKNMIWLPPIFLSTGIYNRGNTAYISEFLSYLKI